MYTVYVLYSPGCRKCYTGFTSNLKGRLAAHNELSHKGWTKECRPWEILHVEEYETKQAAMLREQELKSGKGRDFIRSILVQR